MATKVTEENVITTQEGTKLTVKPLSIRSLRKFMDVIDEMNVIQEKQAKEFRKFQREVEKYTKAVDEDPDTDLEEPEAPKQDEFEIIEIMMRAAVIALEKYNPDFVADEEKVEDELDLPTLKEILKVSGGIDLGGDEDPNPPTPTKGA